MTRFIDADELVERTAERYCNNGNCVRSPQPYICKFCWVGDMHGEIHASPTVDVAPVIHAHKVRAHSQGGGTHWVVCSNCEKPIDWDDTYCRHCGAIMDEEVDDD